MFMFVVSRLLSAWFAFLLPCYSTWKALSRRPVVEDDLQRWAMYWTIIGVVVAFEYTAEWFISWLPFYWEIKTMFLLFLALPQTQGSTYVYTTYLQQFFLQNEADLDAGIIAAQRRTLIFFQTRLTQLWEFIWSLLSKTPASPQPPAPNNTQNQSPSISGGNMFDSVLGLWKAYGPSVMGMLHPVMRTTTQSSQETPVAASTSVSAPSADRRNPQSVAPEPANQLPNPFSPPAYTASPVPSFPEPEIHH